MSERGDNKEDFKYNAISYGFDKSLIQRIKGGCNFRVNVVNVKTMNTMNVYTCHISFFTNEAYDKLRGRLYCMINDNYIGHRLATKQNLMMLVYDVDKMIRESVKAENGYLSIKYNAFA